MSAGCVYRIFGVDRILNSSLDVDKCTLRNTRETVTIASGARIEQTYTAPTINTHNWYCMNVNPASSTVIVRSNTLGGTANLYNDGGASVTSEHIITWIGIHK